LRHNNQNYSFDLIIAAHYTFLFANTNFLFPLFLQRIINTRKQFPFVVNLFNLLRIFFILKKNVRAIHIFLKGKYDKHGHSRSQMFALGYIPLAKPSAAIIYDVLQCPTFYGTFFLKLWIY